MFEVNNIMRFDLFGVRVLFRSGVFNEFPQTFAFILVYDRSTFFVGPFD